MTESPVALSLAAPEFEALLTRAQASEHLTRYMIQMKPATLARVLCIGGDGPPCVRIRGRAFYPLGELEAWALAQRRPAGGATISPAAKPSATPRIGSAP